MGNDWKDCTCMAFSNCNTNQRTAWVLAVSAHIINTIVQVDEMAHIMFINSNVESYIHKN